ncbi:hypothetical protein GRX01_10375 [Halobaculum sp. WSA2]|uniref:PD(D/E)XK endonuclease domain-containing protein n=1 Tax=Halobaculum saliterrae TaxID=2073113 RepID=A0A6B0T5G3_9EURY|nr:group I intron-associated PD-(D/E)XK endonuclease [Halobaculum saliterrae]MXR41739.1 hypothetical protein [Halobaculum saliterrae]
MGPLEEMPSHRKGDYTEAVVVAELKRRGIAVSKPVGDNERYDAILEAKDRLLTVQIKTGSYEREGIRFRGASQHTNSSGNVYKLYEDDVDYFLVYCHESTSLYLVPESEVGSNMFLRTAEPSQRHANMNWAREYEFDANWPPTEAVDTQRSEPNVARELVDREITVHVPINEEQYDLLLETNDGKRYRTAVERGTVTEGRIRFDPKCQLPGPDTIDLIVVHLDSPDSLFLVRRDEYDTALSLRVETPDRWNSMINWAEDYEFDARWPPDIPE